MQEDGSDRSGVTRRRVMRVAGVGAGMAFAGCAGDTDTGDGGSGDDSASSGGDGSGSAPSEVEFWFTNFDNDALDEQNQWYYDHMETEFNIDIVPSSPSYEDMRKSFVTGGETGTPDLLNGSLSQLGEYAKAGLVEPLTERAEQMEWYDDFAQGALNACKYNGDLYGLPMIGGGRVLFYRTDVLDEYGGPPETMEELIEIGASISNERDDMEGFLNTTKSGGVRAFQEFMTHVFQLSDSMFERDGDTWTVGTSAEDLGKVFDWFYARMYQSDGSTPASPDALGSSWEAVDVGYLNGNQAMVEGGNWIFGFLDRAQDSSRAAEILENTGAAKIPNVPGAKDPKATMLGTTPTMLNANSDVTESAWTALREHASPTMLEKYGEDSSKFVGPPMITTLESAYTREDRQFLNESVNTGKAISFVNWGQFRPALYDEMQQVAYGKKDPYDAGEDLYAKSQEMAGEFKV
jgi:ABC-type glycerol-3-phosphate transport system substrate-binding protein